MKALVYKGEKTLEVQELQIPKNRDTNKVLVKVAYAGICGSDILLWNGGYPRVKPPVTIGHEFSGTIIESNDSSLEEGERVVINPLITCGECYPCKEKIYNACEKLNLVGIDRDGGMAEYVLVEKDMILKIPREMSLKKAALIEPVSVAIHMYKNLNIKNFRGKTILVIGAGPIGFLAGLVGRYLGAKVIMAEINEFRLNKCEEAKLEVINTGKENIEEKMKVLTDGIGADITIEATGVPDLFSTAIECTKARGHLLVAGMAKKKVEVDTYRIIFKELNIVGTRVYTKDDFEEAIAFLQSSIYDFENFVSSLVTLDDVVEKGFVEIENGADLMKVLIKIDEAAV